VESKELKSRIMRPSAGEIAKSIGIVLLISFLIWISYHIVKHSNGTAY
jgi:hypothetical protein